MIMKYLKRFERYERYETRQQKAHVSGKYHRSRLRNHTCICLNQKISDELCAPKMGYSLMNWIEQLVILFSGEDCYKPNVQQNAKHGSVLRSMRQSYAYIVTDPSSFFSVVKYKSCYTLRRPSTLWRIPKFA